MVKRLQNIQMLDFDAMIIESHIVGVCGRLFIWKLDRHVEFFCDVLHVILQGFEFRNEVIRDRTRMA